MVPPHNSSSGPWSSTKDGWSGEQAQDVSGRASFTKAVSRSTEMTNDQWLVVQRSWWYKQRKTKRSWANTDTTPEYLWRNNTTTGICFKVMQGEGNRAEPREATRRQLQLKDESITGCDQVCFYECLQHSSVNFKKMMANTVPDIERCPSYVL